MLLGGTAGLRGVAVRKLRGAEETTLWRAGGAAAVIRAAAERGAVVAVFAEEIPRWHFRCRVLGMVTRVRERLD